MWYNGLEEKNEVYIENKMSILVGMPWLRQLRIKKGILNWDWSIFFLFFLMHRINFEEGSYCKVLRPMKVINYRKCIEGLILNWWGVPTSTKRICYLLKLVFTFDDHAVAHFTVCWKLHEKKTFKLHTLEITGFLNRTLILRYKC